MPVAKMRNSCSFYNNTKNKCTLLVRGVRFLHQLGVRIMGYPLNHSRFFILYFFSGLSDKKNVIFLGFDNNSY